MHPGATDGPRPRRRRVGAARPVRGACYRGHGVHRRVALKQEPLHQRVWALKPGFAEKDEKTGNALPLTRLEQGGARVRRGRKNRKPGVGSGGPGQKGAAVAVFLEPRAPGPTEDAGAPRRTSGRPGPSRWDRDPFRPRPVRGTCHRRETTLGVSILDENVGLQDPTLRRLALEAFAGASVCVWGVCVWVPDRRGSRILSFCAQWLSYFRLRQMRIENLTSKGQLFML